MSGADVELAARGLMEVISRGWGGASGALLRATQSCLLISAVPQTGVLLCLTKGICSCIPGDEGYPETCHYCISCRKCQEGRKQLLLKGRVSPIKAGRSQTWSVSARKGVPSVKAGPPSLVWHGGWPMAGKPDWAGLNTDLPLSNLLIFLRQVTSLRFCFLICKMGTWELLPWIVQKIKQMAGTYTARGALVPSSLFM